MKQTIDAIFENGVLKPLSPLSLPEGERVHLNIDTEPPAAPEDILALAALVYEGLAEEEIHAVEKIALQRDAFFTSDSSV